MRQVVVISGKGGTGKTARGVAVAAGCAHPGIVTIVERVRERCAEDVSFVLGGFHLKKACQEDIDRIVIRLRALHVAELAPMHCTGRRAVATLERAFPGRCLHPSPGATLSV